MIFELFFLSLVQFTINNIFLLFDYDLTKQFPLKLYIYFFMNILIINIYLKYYVQSTNFKNFYYSFKC